MLDASLPAVTRLCNATACSSCCVANPALQCALSVCNWMAVQLRLLCLVVTQEAVQQPAKRASC